MSEIYNTLSIDAVKKLFTHLNKLKRTALGYRDRLFSAIELATGLRPTALYL